MNTSKLVPAIAAAGLALCGPKWCAAADHQSVRLMLVTQAVAQTAAKPTSDRKEVENLLARARQAIKQGDFETAETLIARAEKIKLEFSVFRIGGDTPKKLRAELRAAERAGRREALERPSQQFEAELPPQPNQAEAAADAPTAPPSSPDVPTEIQDPDAEQPLELPRNSGAVPIPAAESPIASPDAEPNMPTRVPQPVKDEVVAPPNNAQLCRQCDEKLLAARRALVDGDVRRAMAMVEEARRLNAVYGAHDDTPQRVETAIRNYRQVMEALNRQDSEPARHRLADLLMDQAQQLLRWQDYDEAERVVQNARELKVNYGPFEARPEALLEKIATLRKGQPATGRRVDGAAPETAPAPPAVAERGPAPAVAQALYNADGDATRNVATSADEELPPNPDEDQSAGEPAERLPDSPGEALPIPQERLPAIQLFRMGEQALKDRDLPKALQYFRQAYDGRDSLDQQTARKLQDHLQMLSTPAPGTRGPATSESLLDSATAKQQLLYKQLSVEVGQKEAAADKLHEKDPLRAMELLKEAHAMVEAATIEAEPKARMLRRVDRNIAKLEKYIADNRAQIDLDSANKQVLKEVDRKQQAKVEVDDKLAKLVDEYNRLMDEQRYAEAEVMVKRARELDPDNPLVKQLLWNNRFVSRTERNKNLIDDKEKAAWEAFNSVEESAKPFNDSDPYQMPDIKKWEDLTKSRAKQLAERRSRRSEREIEIERKLKTPVSLKFRERPLSEVIDHLRKLTAVNMHLDQKGLDEEGVSADSPITIDLTQDISLKSALNLILEPLHLSYVIDNEVLKITSEQLRDGVLVTRTYNVADLVIPIPNFMPNNRMGLAGALSDAYSISGNGMSGLGGGPGTAYVASHDGSPATGVISPTLLAQMSQMAPGSVSGKAGGNQPGQMGPGGLGAGTQADFDTLIDLIVNTIKPQTWDEVGGPGSIQPFANNLSLVISQTQEVHEEIVDLLEQLRRNQDLQVTIEVRFITLNDNFFEQIGVDLQMQIVNNPPRSPSGTNPVQSGVLAPGNLREIVGLNPPAGGAPFPNWTSNLDIPFNQSSFNLATPQFGQPVQVANFGFAILSDLEAFLLVNASQGDRRSNVLQAPKVTMFNGQTASVIDVTQQPFVISVIPVVGDFAAAYQPVITVLSEGTALSVQAVISNDRRFVRLTVVPFFSQIGDVQEFTFSGSKTTTSNTSNSSSTGGSGGDSTASSDQSNTTTDGVTVQLPSLSIVSVTTTVSVPDGGTVLLGGIKRLNEGRNEFGVPILSKLPYISRLFKNVGIGRETQSLMMMVTPRIIIQEEEEERLGIQAPP